MEVGSKRQSFERANPILCQSCETIHVQVVASIGQPILIASRLFRKKRHYCSIGKRPWAYPVARAQSTKVTCQVFVAPAIVASRGQSEKCSPRRRVFRPSSWQTDESFCLCHRTRFSFNFFFSCSSIRNSRTMSFSE